MEKPVRQGGFSMVNMGDNAEISDGYGHTGEVYPILIFAWSDNERVLWVVITTEGTEITEDSEDKKEKNQ
jgi:hypothetical protein